MSNIEIYWDAQDPSDTGWGYRIDNLESGAIDGAAAMTVNRIVDFEEGWDIDALAKEIGYTPGDHVVIVGPGMPGTITSVFEDR